MFFVIFSLKVIPSLQVLQHLFFLAESGFQLYQLVLQFLDGYAWVEFSFIRKRKSYQPILWKGSFKIPALLAIWVESDPCTQELSSTVFPSKEFQHSTCKQRENPKSFSETKFFSISFWNLKCLHIPNVHCITYQIGHLSHPVGRSCVNQSPPVGKHFVSDFTNVYLAL